MTDKLLPCPFCDSDAALTSDCNVEHGREIRYWIVRCQKILCDASVGEGCNFSRELAIAKWNTRTLPAYTHRNGNTEAPTVPGLYWFRGTCDLWTGTINLQMALHTIGRDGRLLAWEERSQEHLQTQCFTGQWWGPIIAPWESEAE